MSFSWFETNQPNFLVTRGRQNLGKTGNVLLTIFFPNN